jgi:hypothetical protein
MKFTFLLVIPTMSASSASCWLRFGPDSVREPEEVFLVDRVQHRDGRPLNNFVLKGGYRERALLTIRLRYVDPSGW